MGWTDEWNAPSAGGGRRSGAVSRRSRSCGGVSCGSGFPSGPKGSGLAPSTHAAVVGVVGLAAVVVVAGGTVVLVEGFVLVVVAA
jgi:hypothetical protein